MEIQTEIEFEIDSDSIWSDIQDAVEETAKSAVSDYAWDTVQSDVEYMIEQSTGDLDDDEVGTSCEHLLNEYVRRVEGVLPLCSFGQVLRAAIELTVEKAQERRQPAEMGELTLAVRLDKIETTLRELGIVLKANTEPF